MSTMMMNQQTTSALRRLPTPQQVLRKTPRAAGYLFLAWPVAMAGFIATVVLLSMATSIILAPIAIPLALFGARIVAQFERRLQHSVLERDDAHAVYAGAPPDAGLVARVWRRITDPQSWMDVAWNIVGWFPDTITWSLMLFVWGTGISQVLWPAYGWALPNQSEQHTFADMFGVHSYGGQSLINCLLGVIALTIAPWVTVGLANLQSMVSRALLSSRSTEKVVEQLRLSRDAGRSAESEQLSKLERDIHDGPQQRLVRLKVDLARIERQLGADSPAAASIRSAIQSTQDTLDELRALSRGIAPPTLTELGVVAAVRQAAARPIVPVSVSSNLPERPAVLPAHVEQAAYYVVSEALTNVAKHSGARQAYVELNADQYELVVAVTDDGVGGAQFGKGSGLNGLAERIRSVDGTLSIDSPAGGPTTLLARIPHGQR